MQRERHERRHHPEIHSKQSGSGHWHHSPFCQGEAGALGVSRMPMARNRRLTGSHGSDPGYFQSKRNRKTPIQIDPVFSIQTISGHPPRPPRIVMRKSHMAVRNCSLHVTLLSRYVNVEMTENLDYQDLDGTQKHVLSARAGRVKFCKSYRGGDEMCRT